MIAKGSQPNGGGIITSKVEQGIRRGGATGKKDEQGGKGLAIIKFRVVAKILTAHEIEFTFVSRIFI